MFLIKINIGETTLKKNYKLLLMVIFLLFLASCKNTEKEYYKKLLVSENNSKNSPSGLYQLSLTLQNDNGQDYHYYSFKITDNNNNNVMYTSDEKYYRRHTLFLCWDDIEHIVWCYSGDIGTFYWINIENNWVKYPYTYNENIPKVLRELRSNVFK